MPGGGGNGPPGCTPPGPGGGGYGFFFCGTGAGGVGMLLGAFGSGTVYAGVGGRISPPLGFVRSICPW